MIVLEACLLDLSILLASMILSAMGCLALALSILFRLRFRVLNSLPKNLSASVFSKTLVVFNPFPRQQQKIIQNHLLTLAFIAGLTAFLISLALFSMIGAGHALSIFIILTAANLIILDDAFDVYKNSKLFLNAIRSGNDLGVGDLKVFSYLKLLTRRLSNYYIGIAIFLFLLSFSLHNILYPALLAFCQFVGLIIQASSIAGAIGWQFAIFLFGFVLVLFEIFIIKIKGRIFKLES